MLGMITLTAIGLGILVLAGVGFWFRHQESRREQQRQ